MDSEGIGDGFAVEILLFDKWIQKGKGEKGNSCTESHVEAESTANLKVETMAVPFWECRVGGGIPPSPLVY